MNSATDKRRVDITARDQMGQLLAGTAFEFDLAGEPYGSVTNSDGRADLSFDPDETGPLTVIAKFKNQVQSETIDLSQPTLAFVFSRDVPVPEKPKKTLTILLFLLAVIAIVLIMMYVFRPPQPTSETERAASRIARDCAGGSEIQNEGEVAAGLSDYLTQVSSEGSVKSSDVGTITKKIVSNEIGLRLYQTYTQCLKDQTQNWLRLKGVRIDTTGESPSLTPGNSSE